MRRRRRERYLATLTLARRAISKLHRLTTELVWKVRWGKKPFAEYQRHRMNSWGQVDPELAVGGLWDQIGVLQLRTMQTAGLKPHHQFLDVGAGSLRGGLHLIKYLDTGNYWGTDLSSTLLETGHRNLEQSGLTEKMPHLAISTDFKFDELDGELFDFALAFGVFTDVPADSVRECFANLRKVLAPNGVFLATFAMGPLYVENRSGLSFRYPWTFFADICAEQGFSIRMARRFQHPKGHSLFMVKRG